MTRRCRLRVDAAFAPWGVGTNCLPGLGDAGDECALPGEPTVGGEELEHVVVR